MIPVCGACRLAFRLGSKNALVKVLAGLKGQTPLHVAAKYGNLAVARVLVEEGGADVTKRNALGKTPLDVAAMVYGGVDGIPAKLKAALMS